MKFRPLRGIPTFRGSLWLFLAEEVLTRVEMTWAEVARTGVVKKPPQATPKPLRVQLPQDAVKKFNDVERRTQVLRKLPHGTTTTSILDDLTKQSTQPLNTIVEAVIREPLDKRRFYIRYLTIDLRRRNSRVGFKIGDIQIPPEKADVTGFINNLPHYMSKDDVVKILSQYGDVVSAAFKTYGDTDIRCGGLKFELDLHENKKLPRQFTVMGDTFTIETKDDLLLCTFCDNYGHLHRNCHKKREAILKKVAKDTQDQLRQQDVERVQQQEVAPPTADQMETSPTDPAPPPQPSDNDPPAPEQPSNSQQPQAADPPPSPRPPEVVLSDLSSDDDDPPPKKQFTVSDELSGADPCATIHTMEYVEHPTHPYKQPKLQKPSSKEEDYDAWKTYVLDYLAPIMKNITLKRWPIHYKDILQEMFPGSDGKEISLADNHARYVYFQCVRRTKTDLVQTPAFRDNWTYLCVRANLFKQFELYKGETALANNVCPKDYAKLYMLK